MNKTLNNSKYNITSVFIAEIIGLIITFTASANKIEDFSILTKWFPAIIAIVTLLLYLVSKHFFNKYNWIISVLGIISIIITSLNTYFSV